VSGALGDRLRAVPLPDEEAARRRGEAVVRAAFESRAQAPAAAPVWRRRVPGLAAAALGVGLLAFTSPGQAVIDSVRDAIGRDEVRRAPAPALERLPAPGSLLVQSPEGPWVVRADGSKRLLGPYREATWSPQARFVAVTRASGLLAVEPGGRVRWSLARRRVTRPRWAPSGFRVAYLSGASVRVVAGDGTGDRRLMGSLPGVSAEWLPVGGAVTAVAGQKVLGANVLAVAGPDGRVRAVDVDTRATLWTSRPIRSARRLSWSADGQRLLVATARALVVLDGLGRVRGRTELPAGAVAAEAAYAPAGDRIALVRLRAGVSELVVVGEGGPRLLFAGAGRLTGLSWSPDGRWLLVAWPTADQFLFVRTTGPARVESAQGVASEFDPRAVGAAGEPRPAGWCCATR
jgi:hypothetical protein